MALKEFPLDPKEIKFLHLISNDWSMHTTHFHNQYELNLSISGGNHFFINKDIHEAKPGDLFVINNQELHKNTVSPTTIYERYLIFFPAEILLPFCTPSTNLLELFQLPRDQFHNKVILTPEQCLIIRTFLDNTIYETKTRNYGNEIFDRIKLAELLLMINSFYHENDSKNKPEIDKNNTFIKPIITYINCHLSENLSLDHLSSTFYINRSYLCKRFKKETGFTINQYVTNCRILKSRELLKSGLPVTEAALMIGYQNDSHFIRTFKKLVGVTPKQYTLKN